MPRRPLEMLIICILGSGSIAMHNFLLLICAMQYIACCASG